MAMSPEQKEAASIRMKAMHAKKKAEKALEESKELTASLEANPPVESVTPLEPEVPASPEKTPETLQTDVDMAMLLRQIKEIQEDNVLLRAAVLGQASQAAPGAPAQQISQNGIVGTRELYSSDPTLYPDPTKRLAEEGKLRQFAFEFNYELNFKVISSRYQTIDNIWQAEPRFQLELYKVVMDEESGEATNGRYTICRLMFHEDPEAALIMARQNGLAVTDIHEKKFLDEMRYLRMRDWLIDAFYPPKRVQEKENRRDIVIGGKMVEFFEVNSEDSETIPFDKLHKTKF